MISRTQKKPRPCSSSSPGREASHRGEGESGSESEPEMNPSRATLDIDFGGVDISSNDGGWDTDLELEGNKCWETL